MSYIHMVWIHKGESRALPARNLYAIYMVSYWIAAAVTCLAGIQLASSLGYLSGAIKLRTHFFPVSIIIVMNQVDRVQ